MNRPKPMTFGAFLSDCIDSQTEVRLVPIRVGGLVRFYAHPQGVDGDTVDYEVRGNSLVPLDFAAVAFKDSNL